MDFKDITKIGIGGLQGIRMNDLYGNGISSLPYTSSTEPSEFDIAISDFLNNGKRLKQADRQVQKGDFGHEVLEDSSLYEEQHFTQDDPMWGFGNSYWDDDFTKALDGGALQDMRANNQPGIVQIANGTIKGGITAVTTALDGTIGTLYGVGQGLYNIATDAKNEDGSDKGFIQGLWDNAFNKAIADVQEKAESVLPNYYTQYQEQAPWYNNIFTANFLGDKVIKNAGFTIGALAAMYFTRGIGGGAGKMVQGLGKGAQMMAKGMGAGFGTLKNIAKTSRIGGQIANYLVNSALSASGEASIEAINAVNEAYKTLDMNCANRRQQLIDELDPNDSDYDIKVRAIDTAIQQYKDEEAGLLADAGNNVYKWNMAILSLTNSLEFGSLISGGFNSTAKLAERSYLLNGKEVGLRDFARGILKGEKASIKNEVNDSWGRIIGNTVKNTLSEGFEEGAQNLASNTAKMYTSAELNRRVATDPKFSLLGNRINPESSEDLADYTKAFNKILNKQFGSIDAPGWEEVFLGGLTGALGFINPLHMEKVKDKNGDYVRDTKGNIVTKWKPWAIEGGLIGARREIKEEYDENQKIIDLLNDKVSSEDFKKNIQHIVGNISYQKQMKEALANDDILAFKDAEIGKVINDALFFRDKGAIEEYKAIYDAFTNIDDETLGQIYMSLNNEELEKQDSEKVRKQYQDKARKNLARINTVLDAFDYIEENHRSENQEWKEELANLYVRLDNIKDRIKSIEKGKPGANIRFEYSDEQEDTKDSLLNISDKDRQDLAILKDRRDRLEDLIDRYESDPRELYMLLQLHYFKEQAKKNSLDADALISKLEKAETSQDIENILASADKSIRANIANEVYKKADSRVRGLIYQQSLMANAYQNILEQLAKGMPKDSDAYKAMDNLLVNIITNNKLDAENTLRILKQYKQSIENSNLSFLQDLISEDEVQEFLSPEMNRALNDFLDIAIRFLDDVTFKFGTWKLQEEKGINRRREESKKKEEKESKKKKKKKGKKTKKEAEGEESKVEHTKYTEEEYPTIYVFGDETLSKWESDLRMPLLPNKMTLKDFDTLIGLLNEWSKNNPLDSKSLNGDDVSVIKKYIKDNYLSTGKGEANAESDSKKAGIVGIRAQYMLNWLRTGNFISEEAKVDAQPYIDRINSSNSKDEVDNIFNEAINAGVDENIILPVYTRRIAELSRISNNRVHSSNATIDKALSYYLEDLGGNPNDPAMSQKNQQKAIDNLEKVNSLIEQKKEVPEELDIWADYIYKALAINKPGKDNIEQDSVILTDNEMYGSCITPYDISDLEKHTLTPKTKLEEFFESDSNAFKTQFIIDNYLRDFKNQPIHFIYADHINGILTAVEYNKEVQKYVKSSEGWIVEGQDKKKYLIIGLAGYNKVKGTTSPSQAAYTKLKEDILNESFNGERYHVSTTRETVITNIADGRMIDTNNRYPTYNSVNLLDILKRGGASNPNRLDVGDLKWEIEYSDGPRQVNCDGSEIIRCNEANRLGAIYILVPMSNGIYYKHPIKGVVFGDIKEGSLYDKIQDCIDKIVNEQDVDAVIKLKHLLYFKDDFFISFEGSTFKVEYTPREGSTKKFTDFNNGDIEGFTSLLRDIIRPTVQVNPSMLTYDRVVKELSEAGALDMTSLTVLGGMGANFSIAIDSTKTKPKPKPRPRNITINGEVIVLNSLRYNRDDKGVWTDDALGSIVPEGIKKDLETCLSIRKENYNGSSVILQERYFNKRKNTWESKELPGIYYIIKEGTSEKIWHQDNRGNFKKLSAKETRKFYDTLKKQKKTQTPREFTANNGPKEATKTVIPIGSKTKKETPQISASGSESTKNAQMSAIPIGTPKKQGPIGANERSQNVQSLSAIPIGSSSKTNPLTEAIDNLISQIKNLNNPTIEDIDNKLRGIQNLIEQIEGSNNVPENKINTLIDEMEKLKELKSKLKLLSAPENIEERVQIYGSTGIINKNIGPGATNHFGKSRITDARIIGRTLNVSSTNPVIYNNRDHTIYIYESTQGIFSGTSRGDMEAIHFYRELSSEEQSKVIQYIRDIRDSNDSSYTWEEIAINIDNILQGKKLNNHKKVVINAVSSESFSNFASFLKEDSSREEQLAEWIYGDLDSVPEDFSIITIQEFMQNKGIDVSMVKDEESFKTLEEVIKCHL